MHFGSTKPGKTQRISAGERSRWPNFTFFIFPGTVLPKCILEVLTPEKRAYRGRALQRWPNFTFFNFPGTVLPFFYFSVVRKVPEKPVLFLSHP
jgi:hypothetical protein